MTRSVVCLRFIGLSVTVLALAACGGVSGTGDGGQTGGSSGGGGGQTGTGGTSGGGGQGGGQCAACAAATAESCPADVATADMCGSPGRTCCAGLVQWQCGLCLAETCHWVHFCPATGGAGGGGGSGGAGGSGGGAGSGAGGGGGSAASDCSACDGSTQFCHVTVGGPVGNPPSYQCMTLPSACATNPTCACLQGKVGCGNLCSMSDGGITVTCQAP